MLTMLIPHTVPRLSINVLVKSDGHRSTMSNAYGWSYNVPHLSLILIHAAATVKQTLHV